MPKVGSKYYSKFKFILDVERYGEDAKSFFYTKKGVAAARKEAKRTGKPLKKAKKPKAKARTKGY